MISKSVQGVKLAGARLGSHIYIYRLENTMTTLVANTLGMFGGGFANWLKNLTVKVQAARAEKDTIKELSKLSDYELSDIGISRGEIRNLAREHYNDVVNENLKGWV